MVRGYGGAGLQFTEMVNAKGFAWLDEHGELPDRLWGVADEPRPLGVQIWDNDPDTLASVGRRLVARFRRQRGGYQFRLPGAAGGREGPERLVSAAGSAACRDRSSNAWCEPASRCR